MGSEIRSRGTRWRIAGWGLAALLLLLPLVAMQFTDEVNWHLMDFVFFAMLLAGVGLALELVASKTADVAYRAGAAVALVAAFMLVWVNAAVGIIASESHAANWLFAGVLAVGLAGAIMARFKPGGMSRAMGATAVAQALVGMVALLAGWGAGGPSWPLDVLGATGIFVALWIVSAWLFGNVQREV